MALVVSGTTRAATLFEARSFAPTTAILSTAPRPVTSARFEISDVLDGIPESLQLVVARATEPEAGNRLDSVSEFLARLEEAERELATPKEKREDVTHPLDARPGDKLEHGFRVEQRLGKGSTAIALKVEHADGGGVLKVALDPSGNVRIRREGELLRALGRPNLHPKHRPRDDERDALVRVVVERCGIVRDEVVQVDGLRGVRLGHEPALEVGLAVAADVPGRGLAENRVSGR